MILMFTTAITNMERNRGTTICEQCIACVRHAMNCQQKNLSALGDGWAFCTQNTTAMWQRNLSVLSNPTIHAWTRFGAIDANEGVVSKI